MSGLAAYGVTLLVVLLMVLLEVVPRLRRLARYECAVKRYLGAGWRTVYDGCVVVDMYNLRVRPRDAAATLLARRHRGL